MIDTSAWNGQELGGGRYKVTAKLGEGGMGAVYKAWDRHLDSEVVIKVPRTTMLHDPQIVQRFEREVKSLVRLAHPHIVKVIDVGEHEACPYAVMQYLSGGSLKDRQQHGPDGRPLPMRPESVTKWLGRVAEALDFIHGQHFIHRDVKPANILFDGHDNVYLGDFGVAKGLAAIAATEASGGLTAAGMTIGTPGYMAPELIMGQPYDGRVDQYALGITVYELLVGRSPFEGLLVSAMLVRQTTDQVPAPHELLASIPVPVSHVIKRAIHKDDDQRFESCQAFATALLQALSGAPARPAAVPVAAGYGTTPLYVEPGEVQPTRLACPLCQKPLRLPPGAAGKRIRCPKCQGMIHVAADGQRLSADRPRPATSRPQAPTHPLHCPRCQKPFALTDAYAGKRINCSGCKTMLDVAADMSRLTIAGPSTAGPGPGRSGPRQPHTPIQAHAASTAAAQRQGDINTPPEQPATPPLMPTAPPPPVGAPPSRRRGTGRWLLLGLGMLVLLIAGAVGGYLAVNGFGGLTGVLGTSDSITRNDVITGTMDIDFGTRKEPDNPDAQDVYLVQLKVRTSDDKEVEYAGKIFRRPRLKDKPAGYLRFDISVTEFPLDRAGTRQEDKKSVRGRISGHVPLDDQGRYSFADLLWRWPTGAVREFAGAVQGKLGSEGEKKAKELSINVGGAPITVEVKKADPLIFRSLIIPGDGLEVQTPILCGELTYDYETASYLTDDLTFTYDDATDKVQGTIFWTRDAGYPDNGKSDYVFNLVFNPKGSGTGGAAKGAAASEKELTKLTTALPHLSGTVSYLDKGEIYSDEGERFVKPHTSRVEYHLHANKLTPQQIHNFLKMWLLMSGPVNDE